MEDGGRSEVTRPPPVHVDSSALRLGGSGRFSSTQSELSEVSRRSKHERKKKDRKEKKKKKKNKSSRYSTGSSQNNPNSPTSVHENTIETVDGGTTEASFPMMERSMSVLDQGKMRYLPRQVSTLSTVSTSSTAELEALPKEKLVNLIQEQQVLRLDERSFLEDQLDIVFSEFESLLAEKTKLELNLANVQNGEENLLKDWFDIMVMFPYDGFGNENEANLRHSESGSEGEYETQWVVYKNRVLLAFKNETSNEPVHGLLLDKGVRILGQVEYVQDKENYELVLEAPGHPERWSICGNFSKMASLNAALREEVPRTETLEPKLIAARRAQFTKEDLRQRMFRLQVQVAEIVESSSRQHSHEEKEGNKDAILQLQNDLQDFAGVASESLKQSQLDMAHAAQHCFSC